MEVDATAGPELCRRRHGMISYTPGSREL